MPINQDLLTRIEESADDWGPAGKLGNDAAHVVRVEESKNVDEMLGLHPISIRFPKELVRDLKAIAQLNSMGYQPLIRAICQRFVDAEKRAIQRDRAARRQQEREREAELAEAAKIALEADEAARQEALASDTSKLAA